MQQHQNRCRFSQNFDFRQLVRSCSIFSKKSYFIIENLFEMFDENFKKKILLYNQKSQFENQMNVFFRNIFSNQMRIIFYFNFAINQKSSINQISKNLKSKNLNQHMFAKSIRIVFNKNVFKKSIKLLYKMFDVFDIDSNFFFHFHIFSFFFQFFFLFSHSFRLFQLQKWIVLMFINELFRSLIVSILNLSFRNQIEK